jgi:endonuclease/exonuclease/phosphatase family metal-dependent hydrolase
MSLKNITFAHSSIAIINPKLNRMKFITWNMDYWRRNSAQRETAWRHLETINPDIALLQESNPDGQQFNGCNVYYHPVLRTWGSTLIARSAYAIKKTSFLTNHAGSPSLMYYDVILPDSSTTITVINVYGKHDTFGFCSTTMHHIISDITPFVVNNRNRLIILAGDFNVTEQWDATHNDPAHKLVFDRLNDLGLVNCTKSFLGDYVQTHFDGRNPQNTYQLDYIYMSPLIYSKVTACKVHSKASIGEVSDHVPIEVQVVV